MTSSRPLSIFVAADEEPDAPAVVLESGDIVTFAEAARQVARIMHWIRARVPAQPRAVAVVAALRLDVFYAFHALFELGIPLVPLHPKWTARECADVIAMLGVDLTLDDSWRHTECPEVAGTILPADVAPESALAILLTSGTSGTPKGVFLSRRAFVAAGAASAANLGWYPEDRWLLSMPLAHVGGLSVIVRSLIARRAIVLVPWTGDAEALLQAIERCRVTIVSFVPTLVRKMLDARPDPVFASSVRVILVGGDAASASLLDECRRRKVPALTTYGMTETCAQIATQRPSEVPSPAAGVGRALPGLELRIEAGEIHVRGPTLMSGYVPPDRWPSPFTADGWLPTGDLGELDAEGRLHVRGRRSALIITGGENVDPAEVERALLSAPGVREACVFGIQDERWGQIVAAAVVAHDPATFERAWVEDTVRDALAKFKRPRVLAVLDALVTNATGKIDRKATADAAQPKLTPLRST